MVSSATMHLPHGFLSGQEAVPDADRDEDGRLVLGVNALFVRSADAVVLVDPADWPPGQTLHGPTALTPGPPLAEALAEVDVDPSEVTHVVVTHGHADHVKGTLDGDGVPRFPNADYFFPAVDWQWFAVENREPERGDAVRAALGPIADRGRLRLAAGGDDVCAGVTLEAAPGESPGHLAVRLGRDELFYLADCVHFPSEVDEVDWTPIPGLDTVELVASRRRLFGAAADANAVVVFTHGRFPAWGVIERHGSGFRWTYQ